MKTYIVDYDKRFSGKEEPPIPVDSRVCFELPDGNKVEVWHEDGKIKVRKVSDKGVDGGLFIEPKANNTIVIY